MHSDVRPLGPGQVERVLRRADQFGPHHDPGPCLPLRPAGRRPVGGRAGGLDRNLLVPRQPLSGRAGRPRLRPGTRGGEAGSHRCRLPDLVEQVQGRRLGPRPPQHLRLDREAGPRRSRLAVRAPARYRLHHRVWRRDQGPVLAQPDLPARLPAVAEGLRRLRRLRRALPYPGRQPAAAGGYRGDAAPRPRSAGALPPSSRPMAS